MTTATTNARVKRIERIATAYIPHSGRDPDEFATDLLADLKHWCFDNDVYFPAVLVKAQMHFTAEHDCA
jgi:hypothetical protein